MIEIGTWVEYTIADKTCVGKVTDFEKDVEGTFCIVSIYRLKETDLRILSKEEAIKAELKYQNGTSDTEALELEDEIERGDTASVLKRFKK